MLSKDQTIEFKNVFRHYGFGEIGIAKSKKLEQEAQELETWLTKGYHGEMNYMERYFDMRIDPSKLMPGTKSIIICTANYYQKTEIINNDYKIAKYAYGKDYHKVLRKKLKQIILLLKEKFGDFQARVFVDSAPIMERDWAKYAGVSWSGKNTLSIHPRKGSYFFLCGIITDLEFYYDSPIKDYCGTCKKCIEACPTQAIHEKGYLLDASKCISYLTIEYKKEIDPQFKGKLDNWIFGCDICQEVCPWNRFSEPTRIEAFKEINPGINETGEYWDSLSENEFNESFKDYAIKRTGLKGMQRNVSFVKPKV